MFKPIEEYVEGVACTHCWGAGKTFGDIPTPKRIYITGSGFAGVFAPCNDTFIAEQKIGFPCTWEFIEAPAYGSWVLGPVNSFFIMGIIGVGDGYGGVEGLCLESSTDGVITVTVSRVEPYTPAWKIAIVQNFSPSLLTHHLNLGAANDDEVSVVARRRDRVKLHVRYEPDY